MRIMPCFFAFLKKSITNVDNVISSGETEPERAALISPLVCE